MKKSIFVVISLLAVVAIVTGVFAGIRKVTPGMQVRINKRDLPEHGIQIITSVDTSFDGIVAKHFNNRSPETLKPLSVFIQNSTGRLVVAYALTWELRDESGKVISSKISSYSEPGVLMGNEIPKDLKHTTAIEPGAVRCFSRDSQIEQDAPDTEEAKGLSFLSESEGNKNDGTSAIRARLTAELARTAAVTVSLDGVIFDDGTFVGPNTTRFFEQMQAMLNAKVDLLREIAVASQRGTEDQALDSITAESKKADVSFQGKVSADDWYRYYRKLYATEITNKYYAYGSEALAPVLVRSYERARPSLRKQ